MNSTDSTRGDASTAAVKHTAVSSPFVWIPTEVKRLFQVFNLSPTFIGASFTTKCIPVLLWPEQRSYLQTKEKEIHGESRASNSATRQTKKRKFDETADSEADATGVSSSDALVVHNESDTKRKRMRTGFYDTVARFASLTSINFRSLVSFFSVPGFRRKAGNNSIEKRDSIDRDALHRNKVFHDLQSKSYFIGAGDIYGGDYCLYIGGGKCKCF
jgi:tRNA splicing endonuclease